MDSAKYGARNECLAELIKSEGFSFLQLSGAYAQFNTHQDAYKLFAQNVEDLIRHEIKDYVVAVTPKTSTENVSAAVVPGNRPGEHDRTHAAREFA